MRQRFFDAFKGYPVDFLVGSGFPLCNFKKESCNAHERSRVGHHTTPCSLPQPARGGMPAPSSFCWGGGGGAGAVAAGGGASGGGGRERIVSRSW